MWLHGILWSVYFLINFFLLSEEDKDNLQWLSVIRCALFDSDI